MLYFEAEKRLGDGSDGGEIAALSAERALMPSMANDSIEPKAVKQTAKLEEFAFTQR
ncbi:hypothetical protein [Ruegeria sp. THAF57]|uniref:hypothetical protein n=1 Tax=Ruegeria sp. THAF57 TaxID=2744555 RepID=UPI0015DDA3E3|nr:hypothetical protein [Ruegeria sp. THAF57]